ncbi:MAG: hypothetical protein A3F10_00055 [Coxiella sp. RIFCSPHIGHO2_12_FULL_42_15]|nr:MAG: hypothetical protein A3F10_00055 [Coxiella sp. RIFCSPHIGHO2_12_FULL_42_15]
MANTIDTATKIDLLRKQACFAKFNDEEMQVLAGLLREKDYRKGDVIVREGDRVDSVFLIISGEADVRTAKNKDFPEQTESVAALSRGQSIGLNETGFYSLSGVRTATVLAKTDMLLLRLSVAAFHGFALAYTHVSDVMRGYSKLY